MTTDGDVSARDHRAIADPVSATESPARRIAITELLRLQELVPRRTRLARVFGISPLSSTTQHLYRRVAGEVEVGAALDRLGDEWLVLHGLPVAADADDIDHLVIGPSGVHVISTCHHAGMNVWTSERTFIVAGVRYPYIRDMEHELGRAERRLTAAVGATVEVSGVLTVVRPKSLVVRERQRDVAVLQSSHLASWLARQKRSLSPADVAIIGQAASLPSTWHTDGEPARPAPELQRDRFERLRAEVQGAWRVQLAWAIGLSIAAVGTFAGITYSILVTAIGSFGL